MHVQPSLLERLFVERLGLDPPPDTEREATDDREDLTEYERFQRLSQIEDRLEVVETVRRVSRASSRSNDG